ncbi:MAG: HIT family protein [Acidimicrobiia bacterium]
MTTIFTRIINGEIPGTFVWRDETCVAIMTKDPIQPGHTLVIPIAEVDHWTDLDATTAAHLMQVAQQIGQAQMRAFTPTRVGLMIAGLEVPHVHLHVIPMNTMAHLSFANAVVDADPTGIQAAADKIRLSLGSVGANGVAS